MTDDPLVKVIGGIYAAAVDREAGQAVFTDLVGLLGGSSGWALDFREASAVPMLPPVNMNPELVGPFSAHFFRKDPWVALVGRIPPGTAQSFERYVSMQTFRRSEIYNDLVRPTQSDILHNLSIDIGPVGQPRSVTILRGEGREPFQEREEKLLDILAPHLRAMFGTWDALAASRFRIANFATGSGFDAAVLLDRHGRLIEANPAAARLIARASLVRPARDNRLGWTRLGDQAGVDRLIRRSATHRLPGRMPVHDHDGVCYHVAVDPFPSADGTATLLSLRDVAGMIAAQVDAASAAFALSPGEAALAASLMAGDTIEAHAGRRGTATETVRKQLAALFRKTGTSRQAALVALLFAALP